MIIIHIASWVLAIVGILAIYRTANRRSPLLGTLFAFGVTCRALLGVSLFAVSLFEVPLFPALQAGGGFWTLAIDAQFYFGKAATAAVMGLSTITDTDSSPAYLRAFAVWMKLAGISPVNAVLFNLLCYAGVAVVVLSLSRSRLVAAVVLGAVSVDPALVIFSTQALKDSLSLLVIAVFAAGARLWWVGVRKPSDWSMVRCSCGLLLLTLAVYVMAGIRAYVAVLMSLSAVMSALGIVWTPRGRPLWKLATAYIGLTVALWGAFAQGATVYYSDYRAFVSAVVEKRLSYFGALDHARLAFEATGGGTSLVPPPAAAADRGSLNTAVKSPVLPKPSDPLRSLTRGIAVLFVPVSILRAWSIVNFKGGRGLLIVTDLDTMVIDITLAVCLYLTLRRGWWSVTPAGLSVLMFAVLTTLLLAYVVTNYGTLFRLRLIAVAPLWLLPAVLEGSDEWPRPKDDDKRHQM